MSAIINGNRNKRTNLMIVGILFLFVFSLQFLVSINSYTHDLWNRIDSAIFFMCGKAWMNGMVPYVDFSDSKGPLLWLIFGIGYLFSNHNYLGIFWIECIFYTFTFYYCYKTGYLFLRDKKMALLCSLLMALSFFCGAYHYEGESEDFCQPFIVGGLFYTLQALYGFRSNRDIKIASFALGIAFAATLLIKFTIAAMIAILFFVLFYYLFRYKRALIGKSFLYALSGVFIVLFPFLLYFLIQGNFKDFINDYFIATSQTIVKTPTLWEMLKDYIITGWGSLIRLPLIRSLVVCFLLVNILAGCIYFYRKLPTFKWAPALFALWFVSISMYHALGYYYLAFAVFAIFPVIMYLRFFIRFKLKKLHLALFALAIIAIVVAGNLTFKRTNFFLNTTRERTDFYYVNQILSQTPNPKIMFSFYDTGYGTPAHALPGCKYWTGQMGATEKMKSEREQAIKEQRPDFIFVMGSYYYSEDFINLVEGAGYTKYYTWTTQVAFNYIETYLYGKPGFSLPHKDIHVSPTDILLKRRIIPIKQDNK